MGATNYNAAYGSSSLLVVEQNPKRLWMTITNYSDTETVSLSLGPGPAEHNRGIRLRPHSSFEFNQLNPWSGRIFAIAGGIGFLSICEVS